MLHCAVRGSERYEVEIKLSKEMPARLQYNSVGEMPDSRKLESRSEMQGSLQQGQAGADSECPEASGCGYGAHTWWW